MTEMIDDNFEQRDDLADEDESYWMMADVHAGNNLNNYLYYKRAYAPFVIWEPRDDLEVNTEDEDFEKYKFDDAYWITDKRPLGIAANEVM